MSAYVSYRLGTGCAPLMRMALTSAPDGVKAFSGWAHPSG
jgi:hypothetical protein